MMSRWAWRSLAPLVFVMVAQAAARNPAPAAKDLPVLQGQVQVGAADGEERDLARLLFLRFEKVFEKKRVPARLVQVPDGGDADSALPLLDLRLIEWGLDRSEAVRCGMRGTLPASGGGATSLGVSSASRTLFRARTNRDIKRAVFGAAEKVAEQVWTKLREEEALPAMIPPHS